MLRCKKLRTNVTGILFRMNNTFYWTVRMNILLAFTHSTASWSYHLKRWYAGALL